MARYRGTGDVWVLRSLVALAAVGGLGAVGAAFWFRDGVTPAAVPGADRAVAAKEAAPEARPGAPSFDVVRVNPEGGAVIAGRAAPGAEVIVRDGETEIARVTADRTGTFVALPEAKLAEGGRVLTLASRDGGAGEVKGDGTVVVVVAPHAAPKEQPVVVMVPDGAKPSRVMGKADGGQLSLDVVDYDEHGQIRFTGRAAVGGTLRMYVDNGRVAEGRADANGQWSSQPGERVTPGVHTLRVDQVDDTGKVVRRVEVPFQQTSLPADAVAGGRVVVQPGHNLWRLAREAYGRGTQYTVIYAANRDQIRDPKLIYPGQAFAVPAH